MVDIKEYVNKSVKIENMSTMEKFDYQDLINMWFI